MPLDYDPFSPAVQADPYPYYRRLRDESPCHYVESRQVWVLSRYDDIVAALKNPKVFSSTGGVGPEWKSQPMMPMYDPPEHTALRRLVAPFFTVAAMDELSTRVEARVNDRLTPALKAGRVELVEQFSIPLALDVMADVLGLKVDVQDDLRRWADATTDDLAGGLTPERAALALKNIQEFVAYLKKLLTERCVNPEAPGVIGRVLEARDQEQLTRREQVAFCVLLLAAGWGTTAIGISNTILALATNPDQWKLLEQNPDLMSNVSEEAIRYDGPIQSFFRNTLVDAEVAGKVIPKGSKVQILFASANRDERKFSNPDEFLLTRDTNGHIGYGAGVHTCLGAPLARIVIGSVVRAFLRHVKEASLAAPVERNPDVIFRTISKLELSLVRRDLARGGSIPPPTSRRGRVPPPRG